MPLSRLDNFLKNVRGNILYVSPNDLDSTDDIDNQGNSLGRPFKTIQRALVEASRFSYQKGLDNDRFGKTTIVLYPGDHVVDNRPGWIPLTSSTYRLRDGSSSSDLTPYNALSNFDLDSPSNDLYKLNSVHGGVIVPRGVSIVGMDLRKTKIRPKYVPNPENDNIERTALFRVTGGSYFWQFTLFDGNPNGKVYKDYSTAEFVPNFSHHKVTGFEYADGVNKVYINDTFISNQQFARTDLEMYYEKVGLVYGPASGREIEPDFPSSGLDIEAKIDEFRIVGPSGGSIGISSIRAGDGVTPTTTVTVELESPGLPGLNVDTAFQVNDCVDQAYNGSFLVNGVETRDLTTGNTTKFTYKVGNAPVDPLETPASASVVLDSDTVTSASPYIFNVSLRSVFGMCGLHADGDKATGFRSMVVAQFTGVSLQKDDNAFLKYDKTTGTFLFANNVPNIHSDPDAKYRPEYHNFHIKASNDAICQLVSIFAIGYNQQFLTESGGDFSITNSNSNFGEIALNSIGFRDKAFIQDDVGYITHIIPPQEIQTDNFNLEYDAIDVNNTVGIASTSRLYLYNQTNPAVRPRGILQGYRIGAKHGDQLKVGITSDGTLSEKSARIIMHGTEDSGNQTTGEKIKTVGRTATGINSITSNIITFTDNHQFLNGETIRFVSDTARLPDGLINNKVYFAVTDGLNPDQLKVAASFSEAAAGDFITINNKGGQIQVQSRVSDKIVGDVGHPVQFDTVNQQWYINVGSASTDNTIYSTLTGVGMTALGEATSRSYIIRKSDDRSLSDKIYKFRYVIPSGVGITSARPPRTSFVLQESNDVSGATNAEVALKYNPNTVTMSNSVQMRNFRFLSNAESDGAGNLIFTAEVPHGLKAGAKVKISNVTSTVNTVGVANSGYNGTYTVQNVTGCNKFSVLSPPTNPGTFTNNTSQRTTSLPTFQKVEVPNNYYVYDIDTVREYQNGVQDGVYYLTIVDSSSTPDIAPYTNSDRFAFPQPIKDLYPQYDRDNPNSDPQSAITYASADTLGQVDLDDIKHSVTKAAISNAEVDLAVGIAITDIRSNATGTAHTIYTNVEHGLNRIVKLQIVNGGAGYGNGTGAIENLYNARFIGAGSTGRMATGRLTVNSSGAITDIEMMDPGSNYVVGDNLSVVGVATTAGHVVASVAVTSIYNNIGDTVRVSGITSFAYNAYNQLYTISGFSSTTEINVNSLNAVETPASEGLGDNVEYASAILTGPTIDVASLQYNNLTGFATVTTASNHGFRANNAFTLSGADSALYNGSFSVSKVVGLTTFIANIGVSTNVPATTGAIKAHNPGQAAQPGLISLFDENFGGRILNIYDNITASIAAPVPNVSIDEININNLTSFDFKIGDYIRIDDEIMRIKTTVTSNPVKVFRGLLGTQAAIHADGSVVKRVKISPLELRRPSIIRASGHTFEYLGYGPGNYSTALPEKQSRQLTIKEQLASQSFNSAGGITVFTGMNDRGDFFVGNKKISSNTGKEEVFDTPVPTVTGEDIFALGPDTGTDLINPADVTISRTLRVEGGQAGNLLSQFDGPTLFSKKLTSTAPDGIEANSIFLQGNAPVSRKLTVSTNKPTLAGTPGDVVLHSDVSVEGCSGWVFTKQGTWNPFGAISVDTDSKIPVFDGVGIGTTTPGDCTLKVGSGSSMFCVDGEGVGIGTTANGVKLRVNGTIVGDFVGDGSGLTNLANDSLFGAVGAGGTGIHPLNNLNVGIGTTIPSGEFALQLGSPGVAGTNLYVANASIFIGTADFTDVNVGGKLVSTDYDLNSASGAVTAGIITATAMNVGAGSTIFTITANGVGIGSATPQAPLDVLGPARLQAYYEIANTVTSSSGVLTLDLQQGQTFLNTTAENVTKVVLSNPVPNSTVTFTLKITQGATARTFAIDSFETSTGTAIPVFWPTGVVPIVTPVANKTDIYSFISFDGGTSLYGVVGGQNFS
tara:strand:- start:3105 stop:8957 length:5853 start_codon:yes stop_codon:yes gene_type:complete